MTDGTWIEMASLAKLRGVTLRGARKWATKNARTRYSSSTRGGGRGGQVLEVLLESLPDDLQRKFFMAQEGHRPPCETPLNRKKRTARVFRRGGPFVSSSPEQRGGVIPLPERAVVTRSEAPAPSEKKALTPKQEKTALARADLVMNIRRYKMEAKARGESKVKAAETAMKLYNNGHLWQELFNSLDTVDLKTVYSWDKKLRAAGGDYAALAPQYGHNRGRFSLSDMEREVFLKVLLQPNRPKVGSAIRDARAILADRGIRTRASDATYRRFAEAYRRDNYHTWVLAREGEKALDDKVLPYIERDASLLDVGDVLVADGHPLNFQVLNPWTGKPCRAVLVAYFDWASRYPCGFEVMLTEDVQCIQSAFRRAVINLGKLPKHALIDNGRAFKAKVFTSEVDLEQAGIFGLYARLGVGVRFSKAYNAKDKPIERFFRTFNEWVERKMPSYVGAGIDDKPAYMKRNEKFHRAMHNPIVPDIAQAVSLIQAGIDLYAREPHGGLGGKTPLEVFDAGRGPGVDAAELNGLMMSVEIKTLYRNGIRMFGNHYWSEALVGYKGRVAAKYDFQDITKVFAYDMEGNYLGPAEMTRKFDPLMRGSDMAALKRRMKEKREIKQHIVRAVKAVHGITEALPIDWRAAVEAVPELPEALEASMGDTAAERAPSVRGDSPIFEEAWRKYEYLLGKAQLTDGERDWISDYMAGRICPGEYEAVYGCRTVAGGQ